jgi:hypothetical protein
MIDILLDALFNMEPAWQLAVGVSSGMLCYFAAVGTN